MNGAETWDGSPRVAVHARLEELATASRLPVPRLEVEEDPKGRMLHARVHRDTDDGQDRITISSQLLEASEAEQTWHLAAALGWWTSPEPRRYRRRSRIAYTAILVPHLVVGLAAVFDNVPVPLWVAVLAGPVLGLVILPVTAAFSRGEQRLLDAAARQVLRAAGHDPMTVARLAFGHRDDPPWHRRPLSNIPAPSRRLAAAGAHDVSPDRPLY